MKIKPVVLLVLLVLAIAPVLSAQAAPAGVPASQGAENPFVLDNLLETLKNLAGVAAFFTAVINALKRFGWMPDSLAPTASLILNSVALIGLVALQIAGRVDLVPVIDNSAGVLAVIVTAVLSLFFQFFVSRKVHEAVLAGMPVIGYSHSNRKAGEEYIVDTLDIAQ